MEPAPFDTWQYIRTQKRGFLAVNGIVAGILVLVLIVDGLVSTGGDRRISYSYLAGVLLAFQVVTFVLNLFWSVREERDRIRWRKAQAEKKDDEEEDDFW